MHSRRLDARTAWLSAFMTALVITSSLVAIAPRSPGRLDRDILTRSRGSNQFNVLTQTTCFVPTDCSKVGAGLNCTFCSQSTYTDIGPGTNGGYVGGTRGGGFPCGTYYSGVCTLVGTTLTCPSTTNLGACPTTPPKGPPSLQP